MRIYLSSRLILVLRTGYKPVTTSHIFGGDTSRRTHHDLRKKDLPLWECKILLTNSAFYGFNNTFAGTGEISGRIFSAVGVGVTEGRTLGKAFSKEGEEVGKEVAKGETTGAGLNTGVAIVGEEAGETISAVVRGTRKISAPIPPFIKCIAPENSCIFPTPKETDFSAGIRIQKERKV